MLPSHITSSQSEPDLDELFEIFIEENFSDDLFDNNNEMENDITDDDVSESSGSSSSASSSSNQPSLFRPYNAQNTAIQQINPSFVFGSGTATAPDLSYKRNLEGEVSESSSIKRSKTEDKLIRNRQSANKSRLKRKNEKLHLEETVTVLREKIRVLEIENNALLTDNNTLSQNNFFLQSLLKRQQQEGSTLPAPSCGHTGGRVSTLSGLSVLCVVFSVSFFSDWLPSSFVVREAERTSSGRVLLSVGDLDLDPESSLSTYHTSPTHLTLQHTLLLCSLVACFLYAQYGHSTRMKTEHQVLPK